MTRGYIVIVKNKKVVAVGYSNSDSYYSELGVQVLDAFEKGIEAVQLLIDTSNAENFKEDLEGFDFSWYRKTKETKDNFFLDYVYEFDADKNKITVYYYGSKILSFGLKDIALARYVFTSNKLSNAFAYNPVTLEMDYINERKEIRKAFAAKMSVEDLSTIVEEKHNQIGFYLNSGKICDVWDNSYIKHARMVNNNVSFKFVISREAYGKKEYMVLVCTPFIRVRVINNFFHSETAAIKALRQFLIDNKDKLIETHKIFNIWKEETKKLTELEKKYEETGINTYESINTLIDDTHNIIDQFNQRLDLEVTNPITTFAGDFTKKYIRENFQYNSQRVWKRFQKELSAF